MLAQACKCARSCLHLQLFDRQELKEPASSSNCAYRVSQEGVSFLLPHLKKCVERHACSAYCLTHNKASSPSSALARIRVGP